MVIAPPFGLGSPFVGPNEAPSVAGARTGRPAGTTGRPIHFTVRSEKASLGSSVVPDGLANNAYSGRRPPHKSGEPSRLFGAIPFATGSGRKRGRGSRGR